MVPKKKGRKAAPASRPPKGKAAAGSRGGEVKKAKSKRGQKKELQPPAFIDPDLAMVIKNPIRAQIVALAHQRTISPSEYAEGSGISLSAASSHFKVLVTHDFLELMEEVKVRGAIKHMYRATKRAYFTATDWGKLGEEIQKGMGAAVLSDFNGRVTQALEAGTFQGRDDVVLFWLGLTLDEETWPEFIKILAWAISEVRELGVATVEHQAHGDPKGSFPVTFGIAGFESPDGERRKGATPKQGRETRPKTKKRKDKGKGRSKGKGGEA